MEEEGDSIKIQEREGGVGKLCHSCAAEKGRRMEARRHSQKLHIQSFEDKQQDAIAVQRMEEEDDK